jgi:hypothetical protein
VTVFRIEGKFSAEDIDDALAYLGRHFTVEATGETDTERLCEFHVGPEGDPRWMQLVREPA